MVTGTACLFLYNLNDVTVTETTAVSIVSINVHFNIEVITNTNLYIVELCCLFLTCTNNIYIVAILNLVLCSIFGRLSNRLTDRF